MLKTAPLFCHKTLVLSIYKVCYYKSNNSFSKWNDTKIIENKNWYKNSDWIRESNLKKLKINNYRWCFVLRASKNLFTKPIYNQTTYIPIGFKFVLYNSSWMRLTSSPKIIEQTMLVKRSINFNIAEIWLQRNASDATYSKKIWLV